MKKTVSKTRATEIGKRFKQKIVCSQPRNECKKTETATVSKRCEQQKVADIRVMCEKCINNNNLKYNVRNEKDTDFLR